MAWASHANLEALYSDWYGMIWPPMEPALTIYPLPWRRMMGSTEMKASLRRPRVPLIQAHTAHSRRPRKMPLSKIASKHCEARNPRDRLRVYMPEMDAATTGGEVAFPMTSREEVIRTATSLSWLRTTSPAARRKIGLIAPGFEGQSMTIST
jgi:hypothetical protein